MAPQEPSAGVPAGIAQVDPELQWIATELVDIHARDMKARGSSVTVRSFARAFCPTVASAVAERLAIEAENAQLSASEAIDIGIRELFRFDPDMKLGYVEQITASSIAIAAAAQERALHPIVARSAIDDYWPFGQEGGFCNPVKLRALDEEREE
jgi:hypothetical protein